jgi:hypothetical protein
LSKRLCFGLYAQEAELAKIQKHHHNSNEKTKKDGKWPMSLNFKKATVTSISSTAEFLTTQFIHFLAMTDFWIPVCINLNSFWMKILHQNMNRIKCSGIKNKNT